VIFQPVLFALWFLFNYVVNCLNQLHGVSHPGVRAKNPGTNLDRSALTFQGKSAEMFLKNTQNASLFQNLSQLTFLSADLCPAKFARTFLNQFPNSFPGISVSEPKEVCHDVPNEVSNDVQRKQCTQAPVQDCK